MENKCEEMKIEHAWRDQDEMYGFTIVHSEVCANCGLKKTKHYESKEYWSYSDGRPDEPIITMIPV